jgi:TetR/AcrR family transcriptional regulator
MPPRALKQKRRVEIMEATLRCFNRSGYRRTTMDDVVTESGLSKGTIYWHFKDKKNLFLETFDWLINQIGNEITHSLFQESLSPSERLEASLQSIILASESEMEFSTFPLQFLLEMVEEEDFMAHYKELIKAFAEEVQKLIDEGIRSGEFRQVDTEEVAWSLMAAYDGILLYALTGMPGDPLGMGKALTELVIKGLKNN